MAARDLINLGIAPDSGTGDSARKGGAKINDLFADIYTNFGDAPINTDNDKPYYGYRRTFGEFEYKVGELHATGKFKPISFRTTGLDSEASGYFDSDFGWSIRADVDSDGIADLYLDSEFYFLSRGEMIDIDVSGVDNNGVINLVLPLAARGDVVKIRECRGSLNNGKSINVFTTPLEFKDSDQYVEWLSKNNEATPPIDHTYIRNSTGTFVGASVRKVEYDSEAADFHKRSLGYGIGFGGVVSSNTPTKSNINLTSANVVYEFVYAGNDVGWIYNTTNTLYVAPSTDDFFVHTDSWDSDQWHKLSTNLTIDGTEVVPTGYFMLPITKGTTGSDRAFTSITKIMDVKVYKNAIQKGDNNAINTEFLETLRTQIYNAIDSESTDGTTDSDKVARFKTVWGTQGAASGSNTNGYGADGYSGFVNTQSMYQPVSVTTFVDASGNTLIFSDTKFAGTAVIVTLG